MDAPIAAFGTHPIQADAMLMSLASRTGGPDWQRFPELWMCSLDHRGATGPLLMKHPNGLRLAYVGEERVTVKAGTFDAYHFRFVSSPGLPQEHPPYDLWCTADGDFLFLKGQVAGYMQTYYELVELISG